MKTGFKLNKIVEKVYLMKKAHVKKKQNSLRYKLPEIFAVEEFFALDIATALIFGKSDINQYSPIQDQNALLYVGCRTSWTYIMSTPPPCCNSYGRGVGKVTVKVTPIKLFNSDFKKSRADKAFSGGF